MPASPHINKPYFLQPFLKLERAETRLRELDDSIKYFLSGGAAAVSVESDEDGIREHTVLRVNREPTEQIALDVGEVATHLRSALETMTVNLARLNGSKKLRGVYFPIGGDKNSFNSKKTDKKISELSTYEQNWIKSLKPYRGGNDLLWFLNKLRVKDFHVEMIAIAGRLTSYKSGPISISYGPGEQASFGNFSFKFIDDGLVLETFPVGQHKPNLEVCYELAFRNIDGFHGAPVIETLGAISRQVRCILQEVEKRYP